MDRGISRFLLFLLLLPYAGLSSAQTPEKTQRPAPTIADFVYANDSERQRLDFWRATTNGPAPVVVLIHGGAWKNGDKTYFDSAAIEPFLAAGVSVAAVNYRFISQAMEQKIEPPVKASVRDAARALQTIRSKAKEWNLDPRRIGAMGVSAGACTSLWLALHDDLADPGSGDPIARESTRLTCAGGNGAQTSLDPKEVREWMPNSIYGGHAFGFAAPGRSRAEEFELLIPNREKLLPWIKEYSPISHVTSDDRPLYLDYPNQKAPAVMGHTEPDPPHSALHGIKLAEKYQALGLEAVVSYPGHLDQKYGTLTKFMIVKLTAR
jgi:acetyl esterase/lipase